MALKPFSRRIVSAQSLVSNWTLGTEKQQQVQDTSHQYGVSGILKITDTSPHLVYLNHPLARSESWTSLSSSGKTSCHLSFHEPPPFLRDYHIWMWGGHRWAPFSRRMLSRSGVTCANDPAYRTSSQAHRPLSEDSHHPISQARKPRLRERTGLAKVAPAISGGGWLGAKQLMTPGSSPESKPVKKGSKAPW